MYDTASETFNEARLLWNRLLEVLHDVHGDSGVNPSHRAVLEYLHHHPPTSVAALARARNVSRQHIQTVMNALHEQGLVTPAPNPAHRRSPLFALTASGARTIADMVSREREYLAARLRGLDERRLREASWTLADLRQRL